MISLRRMPTGLNDLFRDMPTGLDDLFRDMPAGLHDLLRRMPTGLNDLLRHMPTGLYDLLRHMPTGLHDFLRHMPTGLHDFWRHMPTGFNDLLSQAMFTFRNSEFLYETSFDDYSFSGPEGRPTFLSPCDFAGVLWGRCACCDFLLLQRPGGSEHSTVEPPDETCSQLLIL